MGSPAAQGATGGVDAARLLAGPLRELGSELVEMVGQGFDAQVWRLGEEHALRIPLHETAARQMEVAASVLPSLVGQVLLELPEPLLAGSAAPGAPFGWSVCRWIEGEAALGSPAFDAAPSATALGAFLRTLHACAISDPPHNPFRSIPLEARLAGLGSHLELVGPRARDLLEAAVIEGCTSKASGLDRRWIHGDLHPGNIILRQGRVVGVIDFGDLCGGDPATDLAVAWLLFDSVDRQGLFDAYGDDDDDLLRRSRGWAALFTAIYASLDDRAADLRAMVPVLIGRLEEG